MSCSWRAACTLGQSPASASDKLAHGSFTVRAILRQLVVLHGYRERTYARMRTLSDVDPNQFQPSSSTPSLLSLLCPLLGSRLGRVVEHLPPCSSHPRPPPPHRSPLVMDGACASPPSTSASRAPGELSVAPPGCKRRPGRWVSPPLHGNTGAEGGRPGAWTKAAHGESFLGSNLPVRALLHVPPRGQDGRRCARDEREARER